MSLLESIQRAADEPLNGHAPKRKGMSEDTARRVRAVVIDEVLALALEYKLDRDWSSSMFLAKLRAMKGDGNGA